MARPTKLTLEQLEPLLEEWANVPYRGKERWYLKRAAELRMSVASLRQYMLGYRPKSHQLRTPHAAYAA